MAIFERAMDIVQAAGIKPFGIETSLGWRWRVSQDVFDAASRMVEERGHPLDSAVESRLFGYPLDVDESLPPNSMLLEFLGLVG